MVLRVYRGHVVSLSLVKACLFIISKIHISGRWFPSELIRLKPNYVHILLDYEDVLFYVHSYDIVWVE